MPNILLFAVNEPRKNLFNQYHGFLIARRIDQKLILHSNVVTDQPQLFIHNYGWLNRKDYNNVIKSCRVALNVYPFESFSYQTIEVILLGCIPIISPSVRDNLNLPESIMVKNIDSPKEISKKIIEIINWSDTEYKSTLKQCQGIINLKIEKNNAELRQMLEALK